MVFIETPVFKRRLFDLYDDHLLDPEEYRQLQNAILEETTRIDTISGTGGIEKARWKTLGGGKSGGVRVIFYRDEPSSRCLLLLVYKKGRQDKLTPEERKVLRSLVEREFKNKG